MFIKIGGVVLVVTIISHTQTVEKPNLKTIQNPDGQNDTFSVKSRQKSSESSNSTKKKWKFEDYLKKFEPGTIWEQIDKQKKYKGLILSDEKQSEIMLQAMDPTDELMELNIENGDPKLVLDQNGRKSNDPWKPSRTKHGYEVDRFELRARLHELMKQAIYSSRNKMVIMQIYREKYKNSSLYKMGFLFNKADNAAKTFSKFSFKAYRACVLAREKIIYRLPIFDIMSANERQMHLWFNVEILADLILDNDAIAREIISKTKDNRWLIFNKKFID